MQKDYGGPGVFADYLDREVQEDAYFAILGRALWLSTRFEEGCKSILMIVRFDDNLRAAAAQNPPRSLDDVAKLIETFSDVERSKPLGVAIRQIEPIITDTDATDVLDRARQARNFVAHESASRFDLIVDDPPKREARLAELRQQVRFLADGDRLTSTLISVLTKEPVLRGSAYEEYAERIVVWVCELWPGSAGPN